MSSRVHGFRALGSLVVALGLSLAAVGCGGGDEGSERGAGSGGSAGEPGGGDEQGGSGGSGDGNGPEVTLTGFVAGAIEGATVFVDLDADWSLDEGEPSALTNAEGAFELVAGYDAASHALVALVPATAVETRTGAAVREPYVLAVPGGAGSFISPLSSLVAGLLQRYPSFTVDEARAAIGAKLALGYGFPLFDDYVADGASGSETAAESQRLERIARVLTWSFGIDTARVAESAEAPIDARAVFTLVTHTAELQLPKVVQGVGSAALADDELLVLAAVLEHVDAASLEQRLDKSAPAARMDFFETFAGDGAYVPFPGPAGAVDGYGHITTSTSDRAAYGLPQSDFVYDPLTSTYVAEPAFADSGYSLSVEGWMLRAEAAPGVFSSNDDGSATLISEGTRSVQSTTSNAVDLSGRLIRSYAKGIDLVDLGSRFPAGAVAYRVAGSANSDEYETFDDYLNPELEALTELAQVEDTYGAEGIFLRTESGLNVKLLANGLCGFSTGRDDMSLPLGGSWLRREVEGLELIEIRIPVSYKAQFSLLDAPSDLFVAIIDGHARIGTVARAGISDTQDYYLLNTSAFDAVMAAAVANDDTVQTFGRVAADGYIEGAKVFLDLNDNGLFDTGEPETSSDADGYYELAWNPRDLAAHALVAAVPASASSHLPGQAEPFGVTQPFTLVTPPGQTSITPYTTLAWYLLKTDPSFEDYAAAEAELATVLGTSGSLEGYVNATDSVQEKVRLVAATMVEKLKEARGRILANAEGVAAVVMNPDGIGIYTAMVGASYETLPAMVAGVEALLAQPEPPADTFSLQQLIDELTWAEAFELLVEYVWPIIEPAVTALVKEIASEVIDQICDATIGEIPYLGWLLSPAVACAIKEKYEIACY